MVYGIFAVQGLNKITCRIRNMQICTTVQLLKGSFILFSNKNTINFPMTINSNCSEKAPQVSAHMIFLFIRAIKKRMFVQVLILRNKTSEQ